MLNSVQFNKTMLDINNAIDVTQPKILNLINFTESQLLKMDVLLNDNLKQLVNIDKSIKQFSNNNNPTPSSTPISNIGQTNTPSLNPTIPNLDP